jgi:hypothetical protein
MPVNLPNFIIQKYLPRFFYANVGKKYVIEIVITENDTKESLFDKCYNIEKNKNKFDKSREEYIISSTNRKYFDDNIGIQPYLIVRYYSSSKKQLMYLKELGILIKELYFMKTYNQKFDNISIPSSLEKLQLHQNSIRKVNEQILPLSLKSLHLGKKYAHQLEIDKLPKYLKTLFMSQCYYYKVNNTKKLPKYLEELHFSKEDRINLDIINKYLPPFLTKKNIHWDVSFDT